MNSYADRYKTFSYIDLLRILDNPDTYEHDAIEAVRNELDRREVSDAEVRAALKTLQSEKIEAAHKANLRSERSNTRKLRLLSVVDLVNPIQKEAPTTLRLIRLLTLIFIIATIYTWIQRFGLIWFLLFDQQSGMYISEMFYINDLLTLYPILLLPVITILLALRKKWGWILAVAQMLLTVLDKLGVLYVLWSMDTSDSPWMGNPLLEGFVPQLLAILYGAGVLWILSRKGVMEVFQVDRQAKTIALGIALFVEAFVIGMMF